MYKFSNSELRAWKRCRRKWWMTYYRRLRLQRDGVGPLSIGNMVHKPLEMFYATPGRDPATYNWQAVLDEHLQERLNDPRLPAHLHEPMVADAELVRIMLTGYFEWLQEDGADSDLQVVSAEQEIEAYLGTIEGEEVYLIGKLDVQAIQRSTGWRVFVDHKSVQNLADLPKGLELDEQQRMYGLIQRLAAVAAGEKDVQFASGGMLNMLRKVKRSARANPPFYGRVGAHHNDEVYRTFYRRVWGEIVDILRVRHQLDNGGDHQTLVYANPIRDCDWDCVFKLVCPRFDDGSDAEDIVMTEYEIHDPLERYTEVEKG